MGDKPKRKNRPATVAEVVRTEWLTDHMVRVTVGGEGMKAFANNEFTDRYVKLCFPKPGIEYPEPFDMGVIRDQFPREDCPVTRTYTVRSHDADKQELCIDFVIHGDEGIAGPWAANAKPGDVLRFTGPGGAYAPKPRSEADWHLFIGDESAIPAIASALEEVEADVPAFVFLEVGSADDEQHLATKANAEFAWIYREDSPNPPGEVLVETVQAFEFPEGVPQVFLHGEAGFFKPLRKYLLKERKVSKDLLSASGYWRRGKNEDGWQAEKKEEAQRERETQTG